MGAVFVIVGDVLTTDPPRMGFVERDYVIEAFAARAADPSFRDSVLPGTADRRSFRLYAGGLQQLHYPTAEFAVAIEDQIAVAGGIGEGLAELLAYPGGGGMRGDIEVQDAPAVVIDDEEAVE